MTIADAWAGLWHGFAVLFTAPVLAAAVIGSAVGMGASILPGLSPAGVLALAIPFAAASIVLDANAPAVLIVSVAYGTIYGRAMAALGQLELERPSGPAAPNRPDLKGSALAAILLFAVLVAAASGVVFAQARLVSLQLGPAEFAALLMFLLLAAVAFGEGSTARALAAIALGCLLGAVGQDIETGTPRLTFGIPALEDGVDYVVVAIGLFVVANVIDDLSRAEAAAPPARTVAAPWLGGMLGGSILALLAGFLPTNGGMIATTAAARRAHPGRDPFDPVGKGSASEILGAAIAADIRLSVSLLPVFVLLVPFDGFTGLLRGVIQGQAAITNVAKDLAPIMWLVFATLVVLHVIPLMLLAGLGQARWVPARANIRVVAPLIIAACACVPFYLSDQTLADFGLMFVLGLLGYGMILADLDRSLMFFAFVLTARLEENIRRSLLIARGDAAVFFQRPISAGLLVAGLLLLIAVRVWRHEHRQ